MNLGRYDLTHDAIVVAEIGNNHEGRFDVAQELVRQAAAAGAHAVKFQTYRTELFGNPRDEARWKRLKGFELSFDQFAELGQLARSLGLLFISTPLDLESARFLTDQVDAFKIASGDNDFVPLLELVADSGKPLIVSTGLSDLAHLSRVRDLIRARWAGRSAPPLIWLHCVTSYPAPEDQLNLAAIPLLAEQLGDPIGYSDHTLDLAACFAAVALGACLVEKHFTLDKHFSTFRDHQLSADPAELRQLVAGVRRIRAMRGAPVKAVQPCEQEFTKSARRSIVAGRDLPAGHALTAADLIWQRPAGGLPPGREADLLGRRLRRALTRGEPILAADIE